MSQQSRVRALLSEQLSGGHAHVEFDRAIQGLTLDDVGQKVEELPHTIWDLVEHIRIAQNDILEFSRDPSYNSPTWPEGYWPESSKPAGQKEWQSSIDAFHDDHEAMLELIKDESNDLLSPISHGSGQTLFREAMLIVDHNAYHIGQIIQLRRLLGKWES